MIFTDTREHTKRDDIINQSEKLMHDIANYYDVDVRTLEICVEDGDYEDLLQKIIREGRK